MHKSQFNMKIVISQDPNLTFKNKRNRAFFQQLSFQGIFKNEDKNSFQFDFSPGINVLLIKNQEIFACVYQSIMGIASNAEIECNQSIISLLGGKPKFPRPLYRGKLVLIYYLKMQLKSARVTEITKFVNNLFKTGDIGKYYKDFDAVNFKEILFQFLFEYSLKTDIIFVSDVSSALRLQKIANVNTQIVLMIRSQKRINLTPLGQYNLIRLFENYTLFSTYENLTLEPFDYEEYNDALFEDVHDIDRCNVQLFPHFEELEDGLFGLKVELLIDFDELPPFSKILITINNLEHQRYVQSLTILNPSDSAYEANFSQLGFTRGIYTCFFSLMSGKKIISKVKYPMIFNIGDDPDQSGPPPYQIND